jgi:hypothetical protein
MEDGIARSNVRQERVTESLTLVRSLDETGDIGDGEDGGHGVLGLGHAHQEVEAVIRNGNLRSGGIDRAERIVLSGD